MDALSAASNVVPIESVAPWADIEVRVAPPRPRIAPGVYWARTVGLRTYVAFKRLMLELAFDIYADAPGASAVIARVPMFARLPPKGEKLSPNSRLATMIHMLGLVRSRVQAQNLDVLRGKLWRVSVEDTQQNHAGALKDTEVEPYSVVRRVIARG